MILKKYNRQDVFYPKTETRLSDQELLSLRHRYDDFHAEDELNKMINYVFKSKIIKFKQIIAWGLDHLLYKVELDNKKEYIIRINNTTIGDDYFEIEKLVYDKLIDNKIQNCKIYHLERREYGNFPYDFIVMDFLHDGDFEKQLQDGKYNEYEERELVFKSGVLLKKFHSIKTKGFGFFNYEKACNGELIAEKASWKNYFETAATINLKQAYELGFIDKSIIDRTEKMYEKYDYLLNNIDPVLLHGDYCDHNIITKDLKVVGAIDLTDCMSGDPMHDIAFWLSFYTYDRLNYFLKGYCGEKTVLNYPDFYNKIYLYLLRINFSKAVLRYKYGIAQLVPLAIEKIKTSLSYLELNQ